MMKPALFAVICQQIKVSVSESGKSSFSEAFPIWEMRRYLSTVCLAKNSANNRLSHEFRCVDWAFADSRKTAAETQILEEK